MPIIRLGTETKAIAAVKRRSIDWSVHMEAGDTIATVAYESPADLPVIDEGIAALLTTFLVSGGLLGWTHDVRATIETVNGETHVAVIAFTICP